MTPEQYVQNKAAASGSSFYYAFLFLAKERRAAITAFYAFCREVDDVVDDAVDMGIAAKKLAWWQAEVNQTFQGKPTHPVMQALLPHCKNYGIQEQHLQAVIEGCLMDLQQTSYLDYNDLQRYCHLVAGVVGEVAAKIFGQTDAQTTAYAHKLGQAFQITNIIRDVGEDARRGRIYLPMCDLQQYKIKSHELLHNKAAATHSASSNFETRFRALMAYQTQRAHALYDEAMQLLPAVDIRNQKPGLMMASIYRSLLREIEKQHFAVLNQRIRLTPIRKMWLAWKVQALGKL